jgi:hypothetical protein
MKYILQLVLIILIASQAFSQDTLYVLGGKRKAVKVLEKNDSTVICTNEKGTKKKIIYLNNLYSIKYENGQEVVVYCMDTTLDFFFTPAEMKIYLQGYHDAHETFKPLISNIYSGVIGVTFPIVLPALPWGLAATGVGVGVNMAFRPSINWEKYGREEYKTNEVYQTGFIDAAQKKKVFQSLAIAGISFTITTAIKTIILFNQASEE